MPFVLACFFFCPLLWFLSEPQLRLSLVIILSIYMSSSLASLWVAQASATRSLPCCPLPHQALLCTWSFGKQLVLYLWNLLWEIFFTPSRLQLICTFQEHNCPLYPISVGIPQGFATFLLSLRTLSSFLYLLAILHTSFVELPLGVAIILLHQCKDYNFPIFKSN